MQSGFSLIEMIVVIAIILILSGLAVASYRTFGQNVSLETAAQRVVIVLDEARNRTIGSEDDAHFGVHFETDQYVLFKGNTYDENSSDNVIHSLPLGIEISDIALAGGGDDVTFTPVTGEVTETGTVTLHRTSDTTVTQTIAVGSLGEADLAGTVSPTGTRITDTRHVHFDLGWTIQGTTTLTLVFSDAPNPNVTENVAMADYFDAGQNNFDWTGVIDVNGNNEIIRVQSHVIDPTNTVLSIERDRRLNDKAVAISIDGNQIVSYAAAGTATVGADGGTMEVQ